MNLFATRIGDCLWPSDAASEEAMRRIPPEKLVHVEVIRERNAKHHRLYFVLLHIVAKGLGKDEDEIDYILRLESGHCEPVKMADGRIEHRVKSISWAKMDQLAFTPFFERCIQVIYEQYGILPKDTRRELDKILAPDARWEMT